jgi:hypothetical protein
LTNFSRELQLSVPVLHWRHIVRDRELISDYDGIPDARQFAVERESLPPWYDDDGDGARKWQEIITGPSDATSVFAVDGTLTDRQLEFRFLAIPNRNYTIEKSATVDGSAGWTK